jgi:hypothetical protein
MKRPVLAIVFMTLAALPAARAEASALAADEQQLQGADLATDGPALLTFFRIRIRGTIDPEKLETLVGQLSASTLAERRKAAAELIAIGSPAIPALRALARDPDAEAGARRARRCLQALGDNSSSLTAAAVRLLAARHPAGAVEVLLTYLPHAEDESVLEEVKSVLAELATRDELTQAERVVMGLREGRVLITRGGKPRKEPSTISQEKPPAATDRGQLPAPPADPPPESQAKQVFVMDKRSFMVPYRVGSVHSIQKIQLHVSEDRGRTFRLVDAITPEPEGGFVFTAPHDGWYWFAVQVCYKKSYAGPANADRLVPTLGVFVDTAKPLVSLEREKTGKGIVVAWEASDENLDLSSLTLSYRRRGETQWRPLVANPTPKGRYQWQPKEKGCLEVRLCAADTANNKAEATITIER